MKVAPPATGRPAEANCCGSPERDIARQAVLRVAFRRINVNNILLRKREILRRLIRPEAVLSWCDKLAATPSVGFKVDFRFESVDAVLHSLSPMLDTWVEGDRPTFTVERRDPFAVTVTTQNGYQYAVEPSRLSVTFQHSMHMKMVSGGPPVAEMLSHALPYTELLPQVAKRLMDLTSLICARTTRNITRIGVVAAAFVDASEIPPGMARFITYVGRPWKGLIDYYTFAITAALDETSRWSDRCIHHLSKIEDDPGQLIRLNFDWQRTFKTGCSITPESMKELVNHAEESAVKYFEDLAEGNLFDEKLIREST